MAKLDRLDRPIDNRLSLLDTPSPPKIFNRLRRFLSTDTKASLDNSDETTNRTDDLESVRHTAERIDELEDLLIRRIAEIRSTDRETDRLICRLRIVTNRLKAQLNELRDK